MSTASSSLVSPSPVPSSPSTPPQNPHLLNSAPHTLLSLYSRGNPSAVIALSPCLIQTTPVSETTGYIQELNGDAHYVTHDYHQASSAYLHAINIHSSLPSSAASLTSKSYCFFKSALCTIATFPHIPAHLTPANVAASMEILEDEVLPMLERIPPGHLTASMCLLFARLLNLKYGAIPASQAPSRLKTLFINAIALDPYITLEITADEIAKHLDQDEAIAALQQGQEVVRARAERKAAVKTELTVANGPCQQKELQVRRLEGASGAKRGQAEWRDKQCKWRKTRYKWLKRRHKRLKRAASRSKRATSGPKRDFPAKARARTSTVAPLRAF